MVAEAADALSRSHLTPRRTVTETRRLIATGPMRPWSLHLPSNMMKVLVLAALVTCFAGAGIASAATVLITGSTRGIGFEFVKQYAEVGWTVIATALDPAAAPELKELVAKNKNITIEQLDVTKDAEIRSLAAKYKGKPIDLLINNAGVLGGHDEQMLGTFSRKVFHDVVDVNTFGAIAVSEAFRDNVVASQQKKLIAVGSYMGNPTKIEDVVPKGPVYYEMSKAALNAGMRSLAADLRAKGVTVGVVTPGTVNTEMLRVFIKEYGIDPPAIEPKVSVAMMIKVIEKMTPVEAARGMNNYDGTIFPW